MRTTCEGCRKRNTGMCENRTNARLARGCGAFESACLDMTNAGAVAGFSLDDALTLSDLIILAGADWDTGSVAEDLLAGGMLAANTIENIAAEGRNIDKVVDKLIAKAGLVRVPYEESET